MKVYARNPRYKWHWLEYFAECRTLNALFACSYFRLQCKVRAKCNKMGFFQQIKAGHKENFEWNYNHEQAMHFNFGVLHSEFSTQQNTPAKPWSVCFCFPLWSLFIWNLPWWKSLPSLFSVSITLQNSLLLSRSTSTRFRCMNAEILLSI